MKIFKKLKKLNSFENINWVNDYHEGKSWFRLSKEGHSYCGFINKKLEIIINPVFTKVKNFSCGLAAYYDGINWGFINTTGQSVIKPQFYDVCHGFSENLAPVRQAKASNYGFINKKGLYKLAPIYQLAWNFYEGRALVVINNEFFFINKNGKIISEALHKYYGV